MRSLQEGRGTSCLVALEHQDPVFWDMGRGLSSRNGYCHFFPLLYWSKNAQYSLDWRRPQCLMGWVSENSWSSWICHSWPFMTLNMWSDGEPLTTCYRAWSIVGEWMLKACLFRWLDSCLPLFHKCACSSESQEGFLLPRIATWNTASPDDPLLANYNHSLSWVSHRAPVLSGWTHYLSFLGQELLGLAIGSSQWGSGGSAGWAHS